MFDRYIVIVPPPTPNGGLHLGHVAGPFLAADAFARHHRAQGTEVIFASGTDDNQSYVVTAAERNGLTPSELCRRATDSLRTGISAMRFSVDGFATCDELYQRTCLNFLAPLYAAGKFKWKEKTFFALRDGSVLYEAYIKGNCPTCLAPTAGGVCESCGHPNNFCEVLDPYPAIGEREILAKRTERVLVLELEAYRTQLIEYYRAKSLRWRPHIRNFVSELLDGSLPDFAITYPGSWGIPSPFGGGTGQVINAWAEGMPASMYCTAVAAHARGISCADTDSLWRSGSGSRLVYFMGFDNSYFWGITHLALLMAHDGRYILPEMMVTNEFYELEKEKFSTSKGHVLLASDITREYDVNAVRFYLGLTSPENHRTSFSLTEMEECVSSKLLAAWGDVKTRFHRVVGDDEDVFFNVSERGKYCAARIAERIGCCFEPETFSVREASNWLLIYLERLSNKLAAVAAISPSRRSSEIADLAIELETLLVSMAPIVTAWSRHSETRARRMKYSAQDIRTLLSEPMELKLEGNSLRHDGSAVSQAHAMITVQ